MRRLNRPVPRTVLPTLLSLILPLILRLGRFTLQSPAIFVPLALFFLISEKGYRDTLETLSPELSEHTGPFSHIGVCLLAQLFVQDVEGWRGEVLFWTVFVRWALGIARRHRVGINLFRDAYRLRFRWAGVRLHALFLATLLTPIFMMERMGWIQATAVWLHFYHSMGYMFAFGVYFCFPNWRSDLVEKCKRTETLSDNERSELYIQY
ncbi:hypothetical protein P280DRAFT_514704 [Massarina eburnea CBS 473.64]|uniref:Uncharacterized protein n=1 Tax=Massarina eburnea CBS 473.64 TaxID=1395130 RepID=A0A6A6S7Y3_9PLEO|nr:hypothetical protein P280DRAFT_514704 [Massarina eburnea CBS 473.64]